MPIPTDVRNAVVNAYYPRALAVPDTARSRAQAAYGIASAIAAALVAAGVFGGIDKRPVLVQALGFAALVAWLTAAGFFLIAVSVPFTEAEPTANTVGAFVRAALDSASDERNAIDKWQRKARWTSFAAAILTVAALVAAVREIPSTTSKGVVALSRSEVGYLHRVCPGIRNVVRVFLEPSDLQNTLVLMTVSPGICGTTPARIAVPRGQILSAALTP